MEDQDTTPSTQEKIVAHIPKRRAKKIWCGIAVAIALLSLAGIGYLYVTEKDKSQQLQTDKTSLQSEVANLKNIPPKAAEAKPAAPPKNIYDEMGWKTHTNQKLGVTFRYPDGWFVTEKNIESSDAFAPEFTIYVDDHKYGEEYEGTNDLTLSLFEGEKADSVVDELNAPQQHNGKCKFQASFIESMKANSATCKGEYGTRVSYGVDRQKGALLITHCTVDCPWNDNTMPINYRMILQSIDLH